MRGLMLDRSIVVPLYQESARIRHTVQCLSESALIEPGTELVFVDDGSTDGTREVLHAALEEFGLAARVLALPGNRGKGAAVRTGVLASTGAVVAFVDADLSSPPSAVLDCLLAVEKGAQVAVASRGHSTSDIRVHQSSGREAAGKTFNWLVRALGLTDLPDTQCGLKAFDRASALALFGPLSIRRFAFDVEVLARASSLGLRVQVIPTQWAHVEQSRVAPLRDGLRMACDALRVRRATRQPAHPPPPVMASGQEPRMVPEAYEAMARVERDHWWFVAKRLLLRQHLRNRPGHRGLVVDVGCGSGGTLDELRELGFRRVIGTDADPRALCHAAARASGASHVVGALAERLPLRSCAADVLTSLDVVEHLDDDVRALREYRRVLRPGGELVLTVPAYAWAWSSHDVALGHRRRYTRGPLEEALVAAGFVDVRTRYFHSWLVPVALVLRKTPLRRLVAHSQAEEVSRGGRWQNELGHRLAAVDRRVALPFGLSLFASAQRPADD